MVYFGATFGKFGLLLFQHLVTLAAVDRDLLNEIVTSLLYEADYSEELKMKIIQAKMNHLANQNINDDEQ